MIDILIQDTRGQFECKVYVIPRIGELVFIEGEQTRVVAVAHYVAEVHEILVTVEPLSATS